ncbi:MAG: methyltransferase [Pseudomonadota bacterium]
MKDIHFASDADHSRSDNRVDSHLDPSLPPLSRDSFFRGGFEAYQPIGVGHRSGSDALLLAASLPKSASGMMAELGAGSGVAAFAALKSHPELRAVLVEIEPLMAEIAKRSLSLPVNAEFAERAAILVADAALSGEDRKKSGLDDTSFDHVIMNPPYNHSDRQPSKQPLKALAHQMRDGGLDAWLRTGSAILRPGGWMHLIYRAEAIGEIISSMQGRFGAISIVPLHAKAGEKASRIVVRGKRGSRANLSILPGVILHEADGKPTAMAEELINGRRSLID